MMDGREGGKEGQQTMEGMMDGREEGRVIAQVYNKLGVAGTTPRAGPLTTQCVSCTQLVMK